MTSEYTEQDRHNENCCWTWPRDQCPGDGCRCVCHMSGEPVRTTYFDLLKEIEGYRQRSRDEDTARIRLNHARIEAEERAAKAKAERDDALARMAAAEAALARGRKVIISTIEAVTPEPCRCVPTEFCSECLPIKTLEQALAAMAGSRERAQGERA